MIKWTGSKAWLVPAINHMDECFEPFAGSAQISLSCADKVYLNDKCTDLVNFYTDLKVQQAKIVTDADNIFNEIQHSADPKQEFYRLRQSYNLGDKSSAKFLALLYLGFNGLWRESKNGVNVPYGGNRKFASKTILAIPANKIQAVTAQDWKLTSPPNETCVVYVDPPYAGTFTDYTKNGWSPFENEKLFSYLGNLSNPVILSCKKTDENAQLLTSAGFDYVPLKKVYTNGARSSVRKDEILAFNSAGVKYIKFSQLKISKEQL